MGMLPQYIKLVLLQTSFRENNHMLTLGTTSASGKTLKQQKKIAKKCLYQN
jgi:hypothetical protein